jgi:putative hemolysin
MTRIVDTQRILRALRVASPPEPIMSALEHALGIAQFERLCAGAGVNAGNADVRKQIADVFAAGGIRWEVSDAARPADLKRAGPLIFYSNHPYGFADALIALSIALELRPDTKVLANSVLAAFDFHPAQTIWVDLGSNAERLATNRRSLRDALRHLHSGGALLIFPSQVCSHFTLRGCGVTDPPWTPHLLALIDHTDATCVPLYFGGHNSWRFQCLGLIHPMFRTLLLLREFVDLKGRCIDVHVGEPVRAAELANGASPIERLHALRVRVYELGAPALTERFATG